jgi:hypothetical protein
MLEAQGIAFVFEEVKAIAPIKRKIVISETITILLALRLSSNLSI